MESSADKQWASKYLLDPLTAPEPSEETGPGSHFVRPQSSTKTPPVAESSKHRKSPSSSTYPTPPTSASPTKSSFHHSNPYSSSHRQAAFGAYPQPGSLRTNSDEPLNNGKGRRRGSSLGERFPGDLSHRPLDQIRKDTKVAHRSPHLRKKHIPGTDIIDSLDRSAFGTAYHHEGPYDATLASRNTSYKSSPVAAVRDTNNEALRATPRENIRDALDKHVPLQGTAVIPPGMVGMDGRVMNYEEGADLMREPDAPGGAYKRWPDQKYHPEDYKGKGEPSFTIERELKNSKSHRRNVSEGTNGIEMQPQRNRPMASRHRSASGGIADLGAPSKTARSNLRYSEVENDMNRSNSTGRKLGEGLKKRFGSLRRSKKHSDE